MKRKRRRRLQRVPEAFERSRCAHDVHFLFLVYNVSQFTICSQLLCFSSRELADDAKGIVASGFVLLSTVRCALIRFSIATLLFRTRPSYVGDMALV